MRRFVTAALLALFVCQSSGAAIAAPATITGAPSLIGQVQFAFAQVLSSLQTTHIGALLTGKESQYEAMHAAPPDFTEVRKPHEHANPHLSPPHAAPVFHIGKPLYPRMLDPRDLDPKTLPPDPRAMAAANARKQIRRANVRPIMPTTFALDLSRPVRRTVSPMTIGAVNGSGTTGINPWWTYEEGPTQGVGKWMVNVATGNLIVQESDVDIPERGIDLAFRLTYNSQSEHDYANSDNSVASNFGNGWTNTFDAHIRFNSGLNTSCPAAQGITIYDIDGAQYDYAPDCAGHYVAPAGMQGTSVYFDGGCGYLWVKKSGTEYDFSAPNYSLFCPGWTSPMYSAYNGRLYEILARNHNNYIRFTYGWDNGDASTAAHLTTVTAAHSDGQALTLRFADFSGYRELASVTRPDGVQVTYQYDNSGNLTWVTKPGNNTSATLQDAYGYWSGYPHRMNWAASPTWTLSGNAKGAYNWFDYNSSGYVSGVQLYGWDNFTPNDGTNLALQPASAQQHQQLNYTSFSYPSAGETHLTDAYGRATNWFYDGSGRTTETQEWTGAPNNLWLTTYAAWDTDGLHNNDLNETVDALGHATDYGYDGNGNMIWVQEPTVQTSEGSGRPVARFTYDQFNNLESYCDPQYVWTTGASACPATGGTAHYTWSYSDTNEPYGLLTDVYNARGYHRWLQYIASSEAGVDDGLVTDVYGDSVSQADGTSRSPHVSVIYDADGNATSYNNGIGTWIATYDNLNRPTSATDPDGAKTCTWYYADSYVSASETPTERAASRQPGQCDQTAVNPDSTGQRYGFDADGNEIYETHHFNNVLTQTNMWYDGADRLVEVQLPQDPSDIFSSWLTRYVYDLSNSSSSQQYGNLANVQRYIPNVTDQSGTTVSAGYAWVPVKAWNYDALDRTIKRLYYSPGASTMSTDSWSWDNRGAGLLASFTNAAGDSATYTYDALGDVTQRQFGSANAIYSGALPSEEMTYDPDGRVEMYKNDEVGPAFYTYDGDGNVATYTEPTGGSGAPFGGITGAISDPTTYTYTYYDDDTLQQLSASSAALTSYSQQYSYRVDGLLEAQRSSAIWPNSSGILQSADYAWNETFTNAGRLNYKSDTISDPCLAGQTCRHTMTYCNTGCTQGPALNVSYDAYGRISSWAIPSGSYTSWSYDAEGEPTGFTAGNQSFTLGYSTRGELLKEVNTTNAAGEPNLTWRSAGGFLYRTIAACAANGCATFAFDPRNDALLAYRHLAINPNDGYVFCCATTSYQYDAAGRRSGREYDALNRLLKSDTLNYAYGPGTIPVNHNAYTNHASLGVQPLYTTDASNVVQDLKLGMNSDIVPTDANWSGLTVYDRDPFGFSAAQRNATGTSAWTFPDMFSSCDTTGQLAPATSGYKGTSMSACGPNGALYAYRTDGYYDGALTFRGVRTYDSDTQQWSTPDAYQGSPGDPMSGLGYNYAGNNPAMFADPSGFDDATLFPDDGLGGGCYSWGYDNTGDPLTGQAGSSASGVECAYEDTGFGPLYPFWNAITGYVAGWGDSLADVQRNSAIHASLGGQIGLFGADANLGVTGCGLVFGGVSAHMGAPLAMSGGASVGVVYSWQGPGAYLGAGWTATGGYIGGIETGGTVSNGNVQAPGYAGIVATTPGAQFATGRNGGLDLNLCEGRH